MEDMRYLLKYDVKNLNLEVILDLKIEEKIFILHEKKYVSGLIDIDVINNELYFNASDINIEESENIEDEVKVFTFTFSDDLSLVSKKEILIMLAFEMYKLYNLNNFDDNSDLLILEESLKSIFNEYYDDFILLYTLYFEIGKFNPQW